MSNLRQVSPTQHTCMVGQVTIHVYGNIKLDIKCRVGLHMETGPQPLMDHLHLTTTTFFFLNPGSDRGSASCGDVENIVDINSGMLSMGILKLNLEKHCMLYQGSCPTKAPHALPKKLP